MSHGNIFSPRDVIAYLLIFTTNGIQLILEFYFKLVTSLKSLDMESSAPVPTTDARDDLIMKIQNSERKLLVICQQLHFLREKERDLTSRAAVAKSNNQRSLYYNLVLRRSVLEGVINVLYEYVRDRADEIRDLRWDVYRQIIVIVTDSDSDMDVDDDDDEVDELFV